MRRKPADPELVAAGWLHATGLIGLILSLAAFLLFVTGLIPASVEPAVSADGWSLSSSEYQTVHGMENDAGWMFGVFDGYAVSTAALAVLASAALPTLIALSVSWFRRRNRLYGWMALAVSGVLLIAILG